MTGRPRITPGDPTQPCSLTLRGADIEFLAEIGGGNVSAGVRMLINEYRVRHSKRTAYLKRKGNEK